MVCDSCSDLLTNYTDQWFAIGVNVFDTNILHVFIFLGTFFKLIEGVQGNAHMSTSMQKFSITISGFTKLTD
jgi:hypothetical protein